MDANRKQSEQARVLQMKIVNRRQLLASIERALANNSPADRPFQTTLKLRQVVTDEIANLERQLGDLG